jgi:hypothetical protein
MFNFHYALRFHFRHYVTITFTLAGFHAIEIFWLILHINNDTDWLLTFNNRHW